jgi:hypothetical protein
MMSWTEIHPDIFNIKSKILIIQPFNFHVVFKVATTKKFKKKLRMKEEKKKIKTFNF